MVSVTHRDTDVPSLHGLSDSRLLLLGLSMLSLAGEASLVSFSGYLGHISKVH